MAGCRQRIKKGPGRMLPPRTEPTKRKETGYLWSDLDCTDIRIIGGALAELNGDLAAGDAYRESLIRSYECPAGLREDIEIVQHLISVDGHVELPLSRTVECRFGEFQRYVVIPVRHRKRIGEVAPTARLV